MIERTLVGDCHLTSCASFHKGSPHLYLSFSICKIEEKKRILRVPLWSDILHIWALTMLKYKLFEKRSHITHSQPLPLEGDCLRVSSEHELG